MANLVEGLKNLPESLESIRNVLSDIYGVFTAVGNFFAWLGLYGMLLLAVSMILLYLLSVVSPLERRGNYVLTLGVVSFTAYGFSFPIESYLRYVVVMILPAVVSYILLWVGEYLLQLWKRNRWDGTDKESVMLQLLQSSSDFQKEGDARKLKAELEALISRL